MLTLTYDAYLDKVLGGWLGKCIGGTIGARFEANKTWIEVDELFPDKVPPNDDLDMQVLWLKVLEERGAALRSEHLADAWMEGCWYPFNEYGIFRRNWRLGIHPPASGSYCNQFWETGEGCPIRAEIWGYACPGAPHHAARLAQLDGQMDHTAQSVGAEKMLAAMASMAFFADDVRGLAEMFIHYLPVGTPIERGVRAAMASRDDGLTLREARERVLLVCGFPEGCDAQVNIPFTFLGLLYGDGDMEKTMRAALACGYDTDCTLASSAALLGQILGARRIPEELTAPIGDVLVMDIEYTRPEMTLSALARDTARMGVLLAQDLETGVEITGAPQMAPLPETALMPEACWDVHYVGLPGAAPGGCVRVRLELQARLGTQTCLHVDAPPGWIAAPDTIFLGPTTREVEVALHCVAAPGEELPLRNIVRVDSEDDAVPGVEFGVVGAPTWRLLGVFYDEGDPRAPGVTNRMPIVNRNDARADHDYLDVAALDCDAAFARMSRLLGRPALCPSLEREIDPGAVVGMMGSYCAYLDRRIVSPAEDEVALVFGNEEPFRAWLNGELVGGSAETLYWTPNNTALVTKLRAGENHLIVQMLRRSPKTRLTMDIKTSRCPRPQHGWFTWEWNTEVADIVPG